MDIEDIYCKIGDEKLHCNADIYKPSHTVETYIHKYSMWGLIFAMQCPTAVAAPQPTINKLTKKQINTNLALINHSINNTHGTSSTRLSDHTLRTTLARFECI